MGGITNETVHLSFAVDWSKEVNPLLYTADFIQWDKDFEAYRARFIHGPFDKFFESKFTL